MPNRLKYTFLFLVLILGLMGYGQDSCNYFGSYFVINHSENIKNDSVFPKVDTIGILNIDSSMHYRYCSNGKEENKIHENALVFFKIKSGNFIMTIDSVSAVLFIDFQSEKKSKTFLEIMDSRFSLECRNKLSIMHHCHKGLNMSIIKSNQSILPCTLKQ